MIFFPDLESLTMRGIWTSVLTVALLASATRADDKKPAASADDKKPDATKTEAKSPADQFKALTQEFQKAQNDFMTAYRAAKTDEERQKALQQMPQPAKFTGKFMKLAEEHAKDPVAFDALIWVSRNTNGQGADGLKA